MLERPKIKSHPLCEWNPNECALIDRVVALNVSRGEAERIVVRLKPEVKNRALTDESFLRDVVAKIETCRKNVLDLFFE